MVDYFDASATGPITGENKAAPASNGTVAPSANTGGDTGMDDEIMVSVQSCSLSFWDR